MKPVQGVVLAAPAAAGTLSAVHDLKTLVLSRHPGIVVETPEWERAEALLRSLAADLRLGRFCWSVTSGLTRMPDGGGIYETKDPARALTAIAELEVEALFELRDFSAYLERPEVSHAFRELMERLASQGRMSTVVLVEATAKLPAEVEPHVVRYELRFPGRQEYLQAIVAVVESLRLNGRASVEVGVVELDAFASAVSGLTLNQARQAVARVAIEDGRLVPEDLSRLGELKAQAFQEDGLLEYFPPADNRFELGGFDGLRRWLERARVAFTSEAAELDIKPPKGILLVGVQGCGKSLAAKVIAREWSMPLLKLDAGRLYDKFVGETERNFRRAIAIAESTAPAVLWIDELEKAITTGGGAGHADGGVSRRMFGSFLTWLQEKTAQVFVVATANDLSQLPPELLRKGRFDEVFFVDLPDAAERGAIFRIHLELRRQSVVRFDLARLVGASEGFSGAEIEQAVVASLLGALHEKVELTTERLLHELGATVPLSVSRCEDVDALRQKARARFVAVR